MYLLTTFYNHKILLDSQILLLYFWYLCWTLACMSIKWHYFSYTRSYIWICSDITSQRHSTIFSFIFQRNENLACACNKIAYDGYGECMAQLYKPPWGFTVAKHICVYEMLKQKDQRDADRACIRFSQLILKHHRTDMNFV